MASDPWWARVCRSSSQLQKIFKWWASKNPDLQKKNWQSQDIQVWKYGSHWYPTSTKKSYVPSGSLSSPTAVRRITEVNKYEAHLGDGFWLIEFFWIKNIIHMYNHTYIIIYTYLFEWAYIRAYYFYLFIHVFIYLWIYSLIYLRVFCTFVYSSIHVKLMIIMSIICYIYIYIYNHIYIYTMYVYVLVDVSWNWFQDVWDLKPANWSSAIVWADPWVPLLSHGTQSLRYAFNAGHWMKWGKLKNKI